MTALNVAILWHMHQPDYRDPVSGRTLMPWTYLHAVKDYAEMLRTAAEVPGARMTFNLVPTMIEQLERYASGTAQDVWLDAARQDPATMGPDERSFLLRQFFSVHADRHILPYPRYRQLAKHRGSASQPDAASFSDQDLRDLQVWFLLAWSGYHLRQEQPLLQRLLQQGENFSEADKHGLLNIYDMVVAEVTNLYRELESQGAIEVSVTPYAHPILPLLCGTDTAAQATPGIQLPAVRFRHPGDARLQVRYGLDFVAERLGQRPRGMWPAEGAVSEEALRLIKEEGASWAATDEGILHRSLRGGLANRNLLYRSYSFEGLPLLFRDRELSDRIGFVYAHWDPRRAADDLLAALRRIAVDNPGGVVALILDGENCWERYQDNGHPFLTELYRGMTSDPRLRMVTVSEALEAAPPTPLPRIAPGSWINSDFCIWIGHPEENTAWEWLERARRDTLGRDGAPPLGDIRKGQLPETMLHLMRAEGSDWFWWFGDDHTTDQADIFDRLFRRHLEALYRESGQPVPQHLHRAIKPPSGAAPSVRPPTALFSPRIDGRISDYFEWLAAGVANLGIAGAMHSGQSEFQSLHFGYDRDWFYLRLDPREDLNGLLGPKGALELRLLGGQGLSARLHPGQASFALLSAEGVTLSTEGLLACGRVVEIALPLLALDLTPGQPLELSLHLLQGGNEIARWPAENPLSLPYRGGLLASEDWSV